MSGVTYILGVRDIFLTDGCDSGLLLHDMAEPASDNRLQALVASGDYFETLATRLEMIADALPKVSAQRYQMQEVIEQLTALQRGYAIVRKSNAK